MRSRSSTTRLLVLASMAVLLAGCYRLRGSSGGGQARFDPPRHVDPAAVALPEGYRVDVIASGLTFPTGIAFDDDGRAYVTESGYSYGEVFTTPRLLRLDESGPAIVAEGERNGPWNGVDYQDGRFFIAEGGQLEGGRIVRIDSGDKSVLVDSLPSLGDHHTNGPVVGPDGWLYFGQGTATNSGIVGPDNAAFGWLERFPDFHDIPCEDVTLAGRNMITPNPLMRAADEVSTGAYVPFGTATHRGQVIPGEVPCSGAVLRVRPDGGPVELVAWGLRNPYGLAFAPDGRLFVTENSYDNRGSRPVWGTADYLWQVEQGRWYGWPEFAGGVPIDVFDPPGEGAPISLLAESPGDPPDPVAEFAVHSSSSGFDFSRSATFGHEGDAFVAQFGDMAPNVGKVLAPVGFRVVRVDVEEGIVHGFAANHGKKRQPASRQGGGGLERPITVRFSPDGSELYVVDFGVLTTVGGELRPRPETGVIWRITREGAP